MNCRAVGLVDEWQPLLVPVIAKLGVSSRAELATLAPRNT